MKSIRICLMASVVALILGLGSCGKDKTPAPAVTVKFAQSTATYGEDAGTVNALVSISAAQTADVSVSYTWSSSDTTTFLGGDFTFGTSVSGGKIVIPAGQTSISVPINIIDDTQIDGDDDLKLTLSAPTVGTVATTGGTFDLTISDNETAPTDALQLDLTWSLIGNPTANINNTDLNLFIQYRVKLDASSNSITDIGISLKKSIKTSGFETVTLNTADADTVYWIAIEYHAGSPSNFTMSINGFNNSYIGVADPNDYAFSNFVSADLGQALFFGPFTKSGATFTFSGRSSRPENNKLYKIRVNNFKPTPGS